MRGNTNKYFPFSPRLRPPARHSLADTHTLAAETEPSDTTLNWMKKCEKRGHIMCHFVFIVIISDPKRSFLFHTYK